VGLVFLVGAGVWALCYGNLTPNVTEPRLAIMMLLYLFGYPLLLAVGAGLLVWFKLLKGG